jgi:ribosomal protein L29
MKSLELRKKSPDELRSLLREELLRRESVTLALRQKKAKNVKELRVVRKQIARIHTILRETKARP